MLVTQSCPTFCDPMDCSLPGFSVHGIFQTKEYWAEKPFPSSGDLPNPEIEPGSPALQAYSLPSEPSWHRLLLLLGCYVQLFVTPRTAAHQASLSSTISQSLQNSCVLIRWCHPTISFSVAPFSSCPQSFLPSGSFPMSPIRWPKYWSFNFRISPSKEYSGLISFKTDWFDLLTIQGTLSRVFSSTTVWKHQFFSAQPFLWSKFHVHTWLMEKPQLWLYAPLSAKQCLCFLIRSLGFS